MNLTFVNKKITGILTVIPGNERRFVEEMKNFDFPISKSLKLQQIMGYGKHHIVDDKTCVSDLAVFGMNTLFEQGSLDKNDIDALILVTQSPDYFMPATSAVIQGRLKLKQDIFCMDINQGCAGFLVGLSQAFFMLEQTNINKVVLINADVLSRKVSPKDRNSYPLIGDGASITIIEKSLGEEIYANLKMDGIRCDALIIPAGGFRTPSTAETAIMEDIGDHNFRSKDNLKMDGLAVFNFIQTEVPTMIDQLLDCASIKKEDIEYYLFHQPNKFILEKLADKMNVSYSKMPNNIVTNFGNASGVTIPTNITFNLGAKLLEKKYKVCLAGFGVGLTWASMILDLGKLDFCETINY